MLWFATRGIKKGGTIVYVYGTEDSRVRTCDDSRRHYVSSTGNTSVVLSKTLPSIAFRTRLSNGDEARRADYLKADGRILNFRAAHSIKCAGRVTYSGTLNCIEICQCRILYCQATCYPVTGHT